MSEIGDPSDAKLVEESPRTRVESERTAPSPSTSETNDAADPPARTSRSDRLATGAFFVLIVAAFPILLFELGRGRWFFLDEWDFLAHRSATDLGDLFRPHDEHWSTLPILVYRALYAAFGIRTYVPYQATIVALHLIVVVLLWIVMRRLGVGAWIALLAAGVLVFFGTGDQNIVWAFQIGFVASVAFGLVQLILTDNDGPIGWRDGLALAAGACALMCSGIGVVMVVVVGLACLLRRGWRAATLQVAPLAALYLVWWAVEQPRNAQNPLHAGAFTIMGKIASFVVVGVTETFSAIGWVPGVGIVLAVLLVGGLALAWIGLDGPTFRRRAAMPIALLVGGVLFLLVTAAGRWFYGPTAPRGSRYIYLTAVFLIPALGVAADAVVRRWRWTAPPLVILLLIGIPGNLGDFAPKVPFNSIFYENQRRLTVGLAASPLARQVPADVQPDPVLSPLMSAGWLSQAEKNGVLPKAPPLDLITASQLPVRFGVSQSAETAPTANCRTVRGPFEIRPRKGQVYAITGGTFTVSSLDRRHRPSAPVPFTPDPFFGTDPYLAHTFTIELPDLDLRIASAAPLRICT